MLGDMKICEPIDINGVNPPPAVIPYRDRFRHTMLVGPAGCGKTELFLHMMEQDMDVTDAAVMFVTPKRCEAMRAVELAKKTGRPYVCFDSKDEQCPVFNPLDGDIQTVIDSMDEVFSTFVRSDPYERSYFLWLIQSLKQIDEANGTQYATLYWLQQLVCETEKGQALIAEYWDVFEKFIEHPPKYNELKEVLSEIVGEPLLNKALIPSDPIAPKLNIQDAIENRMVIVLCTEQSYCMRYHWFLSKLMAEKVRTTLFDSQRYSDIPLFLYFDEPVYIDSQFSKFLVCRPSYKTALHFAVSSMSVFYDYDEHLRKIVETRCEQWNLVLFWGLRHADAEFFAKMFERQISDLKPPQSFWDRIKKKQINLEYDAVQLVHCPPYHVHYRFFKDYQPQLAGFGRVSLNTGAKQ